MTPQEIAEKWIAKDGEIRPVNNELKQQRYSTEDDRKWLTDKLYRDHHTYLCPTVADGEYRGEDLEWQWQIQHTQGWGNLREEEVELYVNSNATTRPTIRLKQPDIALTDTRFESPAIDAENIDLLGLTINEAYLHGVISGQKKRIEQLESALKGYVKVEDVEQMLKDHYDAVTAEYITNQIKQLSK